MTTLVSASPHTGRSGAVFDAAFYQTVFPQLLQQECRHQPGMVPVVEFHIVDGTNLDICHMLQLDERWIVVSFFRDLETCKDMDIAILPYELIMRITLSFHDPRSRRIGFTVTEPAQPAVMGEPGIGTPGAYTA